MMHPFRSKSLVLAALVLGMDSHGRACAAEPAPKPSEPVYELVPTAAHRVRAEVLVTVKGPKIQAEEWAIYAAVAPELPSQVDVHTTLDPEGQQVKELSDWGRPMLVARQPAEGPKGAQELTIRINYEAILITRRLTRREPGDPAPRPVAPLDARIRRLTLAANRQFDHDAKAFREWLDANGLRRKADEDEVDFGRRVFEFITTNFTHYEGEKLDRRASQVCAAGKTDRGGLSCLFVSALRANRIPARLLVGRQVRSTAHETDQRGYDIQTMNAEFYAQGVGWVPAEVPEGVFAKTVPEKLEHFGNDPGYFLAAHVDTGLVYDTYFGRQTADFLPTAAWWAKGSGSFDGLIRRQSLKVEVEPVDLEEALKSKPASRATPSRKKSTNRKTSR